MSENDMRAALTEATKILGLIASLGGRTLISGSGDASTQMAYSQGAHAAFNQSAGLAKDALVNIEARTGIKP